MYSIYKSLADTIMVVTGCDIQDLLIPAEELLSCEELGDLNKDSSFKFLVNAGYEKINQLIG